MNKKNQKRMGNKGFSLVELVIVIAIMAVLTAVLAPQFIKYVEQSRIAKDENQAEELFRAVQVAIAEELVYNQITADNTAKNVTLTFASGVVTLAFPGGDTSAIGVAVLNVFTPAKSVSNLHKDDVYTITLTPDTAKGIVISSSANGLKAKWS